MDFVKDIITAIRNIRGEMNIAPSKKVNAMIKSSSVKDYQIEYIKKLAKVEDLQLMQIFKNQKQVLPQY